jgi:hypothetical protein
MKRIAVITAYNSGYQNTGMVSVDLASHTLCKQLGPGVEINWFSLHRHNDVEVRRCVLESELPFNSDLLLENLEELFKSDAILFWGDFLHDRHYHLNACKNSLIQHRYARDVGQALEITQRCFLLKDAPDHVLQKTVLFGGTIINNCQSDYVATDYYAPFKRLMAGVHRVWVRDVFSALKVADLRNPFDVTPCLGTDAALLLDSQVTMRTTEWSETLPRQQKMGLFVGARTKADVGACLQFAANLARDLNLSVEWIPWFDLPAVASIKELAPSLVEKDYSHFTLGDLFSALDKYAVIVTDTYHLSVNAWRAGTPAICIGSADPTQQSEWVTLRDTKKFVFYAMYNALDLYVDTAELQNPERQKVRLEELSRNLNPSIVEPIIARIHTHAQNLRQDIKATLTALL